ncbi:MAG: hypothetical protein [Caudovirales sp. ctOwN3]|nr:MAG: hypothetical protein [Caudovirales sp. ctOwN3]
MERIRKRYDKSLMATHRRRHLRKWALWNRYEAFQGKLYVEFRVLPKRYYWHKKRDSLTAEALANAIRKIQRMQEANILLNRWPLT